MSSRLAVCAPSRSSSRCRAAPASRSPPSWGVGGDALQLAPPVRWDGHRRGHVARGSAGTERPTEAAVGQNPSWTRTRCGRSPRDNGEPSGRTPRRGHAHRGDGLSERFACKVVGLLHRCTYRWLPTAQIPAGPDAGLRGEQEDPPALARGGPAGTHAHTTQAVRVLVGAAGRGGCTEIGVAVGLPVRLHRRRQGGEDRVYVRRAHPRVAAAPRGAVDHRRASGRRCTTSARSMSA